jgi:hypothetical protein
VIVARQLFGFPATIDLASGTGELGVAPVHPRPHTLLGVGAAHRRAH